MQDVDVVVREEQNKFVFLIVDPFFWRVQILDILCTFMLEDMVFKFTVSALGRDMGSINVDLAFMVDTTQQGKIMPIVTLQNTRQFEGVSGYIDTTDSSYIGKCGKIITVSCNQNTYFIYPEL